MHPIKTLICLLLVMWGVTMTGAAETPALPPQPPPLSLHGLSPKQREAAKAAHDKTMEAWFNALAPEQQNKVRDEFMASLNRKVDLENLSDYDWRKAALGWSLGPEEIAQLEHAKVAVGDREEKQAFLLYNARPVFITTDSLLNAYHALMEDSLRVVEQRRAIFLRERFEAVLKDARGVVAGASGPTGAELQPALRHLQSVLGPALLLLGTPDTSFDMELRAELKESVAHIREGKGISLPGWLAPADAQCAALDYGRFKPTGFYADNPRLADYYRAVRWLQLVPFRANHPTELAAVGLLGLAGHWEQSRPVFEAYTSLVGQEDGFALATDEGFSRMATMWTEIQKLAKTPLDLKAVFMSMATRQFAGRPQGQVNQGVRQPVQPGDSPVAYLLPTAATLDALLFAQTTSRARPLPSGLEVAAMLGSDFAGKNLPGADAEQKALQATIAAAGSSLLHPPRNRPPSLGGMYFHTLAALFLSPDPAAPDFMRSEAWAAKSCQTVLAGWAQERHAWTLQAKTNVEYQSAEEMPSGFIEPNPEFFSRFFSLVDSTMVAFDDLKAFATDKDEEIAGLRDDADYVEKLGITTEHPDQTKISEDDRARVHSAMSRLDLWGSLGDKDSRPMAVRLRELADKLAAGGPEPQPSFRQDPPLRARWMTFYSLVGQLGAMVQKQLRGAPWTKEEESLFESYKYILGESHGYYGNSWETPRDDAPRWVEIADDPNSGQMLAAAIGRPRALYVLYPWHGKDVLCVGAVMPYFEYLGTTRLNDKEWKARLDSPDAPKSPEWLKAVAPP